MPTRTPRESAKKKRQVDRIKRQYERRGMSDDEAGRLAAATVGDIAGGGRKGGSASGRAKRLNKAPAKYAAQITTPTFPRPQTGKEKRASLSLPSSSQNIKSPGFIDPKVVNRLASPMQRLTQDLARQIVCREFARMAARGFGKFRVRSFPDKRRVIFQGEKKSNWQSIPNGDYEGDKADLIASVMEQIQGKRTNVLQVNTRRRVDYQTFEVRVEPDALQRHARSLLDFFQAQLFWT